MGKQVPRTSGWFSARAAPRYGRAGAHSERAVDHQARRAGRAAVAVRCARVAVGRARRCAREPRPVRKAQPRAALRGHGARRRFRAAGAVPGRCNAPVRRRGRRLDRARLARAAVGVAAARLAVGAARRRGLAHAGPLVLPPSHTPEQQSAFDAHSSHSLRHPPPGCAALEAAARASRSRASSSRRCLRRSRRPAACRPCDRSRCTWAARRSGRPTARRARRAPCSSRSSSRRSLLGRGSPQRERSGRPSQSWPQHSPLPPQASPAGLHIADEGAHVPARASVAAAVGAASARAAGGAAHRAVAARACLPAVACARRTRASSTARRASTTRTAPATHSRRPGLRPRRRSRRTSRSSTGSRSCTALASDPDARPPSGAGGLLGRRPTGRRAGRRRRRRPAASASHRAVAAGVLVRRRVENVERGGSASREEGQGRRGDERRTTTKDTSPREPKRGARGTLAAWSSRPEPQARPTGPVRRRARRGGAGRRELGARGALSALRAHGLRPRLPARRAGRRDRGPRAGVLRAGARASRAPQRAAGVRSVAHVRRGPHDAQGPPPSHGRNARSACAAAPSRSTSIRSSPRRRRRTSSIELRAVYEVIDAATVAQRATALMLRRVEGMSQDEVAAAMGVSVSTAKRADRRGRALSAERARSRTDEEISHEHQHPPAAWRASWSPTSTTSASTGSGQGDGPLRPPRSWPSWRIARSPAPCSAAIAVVVLGSSCERGQAGPGAGWRRRRVGHRGSS